MLDQACRQLRRWDREHPGHAPIDIAVNLSPRQLDEHGSVGRPPIDIIKIDKAFVDGIGQNPQEWAFTTAIVTLATNLGKRLVAEGIERGDQLAHLIALHCQYGQGYLFSKPVSPERISELLAEASPASTLT